MELLDRQDIQGVILHGYGAVEAAAFVLLKIGDPAACRGWLAGVAPRVRNSEEGPKQADRCLNLAFTYAGLERLEVTERFTSSFGLAFEEGMVTPHRSRVLGDHGPSAPEHWRWGAPPVAAGAAGASEDRYPHMLLMLYAGDAQALDAFYQEERTAFIAAGLTEVTPHLEGRHLPGRTEHFGFRDGIAQPNVVGYDAETPTDDGNTIAAGELLLGHRNDYGQFPPSPLVPAANDPANHLRAREGADGRDFGLNGSYLVFRQLSQDVQGFWRYLDGQAAAHAAAATRSAERVRLASKMVGRWPSGVPLVKSPEHDDPELAAKDDHALDRFGYLGDTEGLACPVGSHVRRTNQRDHMTNDPVESVRLSNRHRILRRGRPYGAPVSDTMSPDEMLAAPAPEHEQGLNFICFNADIPRQFEFVQNTWINNGGFAGLHCEADPLMGDHDPQGTGDHGSFTIPADPVRQRLEGLPGFVQVRGGAYFFMPSISAIRFLGS